MGKFHKVLITGARDQYPFEALKRLIDDLVEKHGISKLLVIHGGANGVDLVADKICAAKGVHTALVDARWSKYGRSAGPIRNRIMIAMEPDEAYAFHPNLEKSRGTKDMVHLCLKNDIPLQLIDELMRSNNDSI